MDGICHGANDEVFDGSDNPVLTGVDPDSTYIYLMQNMADRKGETWELAMETLKDLGLNLKVAISDAGSGLLSEEVFRYLYRRPEVNKESKAYAELTRQATALISAGELANIEKVHDEIINSIKRASSMVENVNGRLRAYMNIKRHVSSNFYSLIQLHMNAKKYRRSRVEARKGRSPLELLTGKPWPEFIDLLEEYGFWDKDTTEQIA